MIEVEGLTRRYGETRAVDALTFTAADGQVTGFVGPNGAGKSTTMRMLLGLERPDAGHALIAGRPYRDLDRPLRHVGALLDAGWGQDGRTARGHLTWLARTAGIGRSRVDEALEEVGLTAVAGRRTGGFSLGMRQRLGLAAALLGEPTHLVLDEPLNGLDPEGVHWMRGVIRGFADRGHAVLVSSHLLSELAMTADSLVVIGAGRLVGQYSTQDFIRSAGTASVRVRVDRTGELRHLALTRGWAIDETADGALSLRADGLETEDVALLCADHGLLVTELTPVRASLEEAFLAVTGDAQQYRSAVSAGGDAHAPARLPLEVSR